MTPASMKEMEQKNASDAVDLQRLDAEILKIEMEDLPAYVVPYERGTPADEVRFIAGKKIVALQSVRLE